ncbi:LysR substrate-binding domain-containing protein [Orrella sp. JC864]|uniref:LysR substrate-binding domain-containing protein n=1 Tax=Orrella sp. JC864 TaxID=3120298 RepID=UPI00300875C9
MAGKGGPGAQPGADPSQDEAGGWDEDADAARPGRRLRTLAPSLSSLRAFEAVARRRSFTKAAQELNLTQTAVSHQVRKLEDRLGTQLFIRDRDGVRLAAPGREYLVAVRQALNVLSMATQRMLDRGDEESLSIVSLAAFGIKCLMPLLPDFRRRYPHIVIRFDTVISFDAAAVYDYDVAIRYGNGNWSGLAAHKVAQEELFPVCSPAMLARSPIACARDMLRHTGIVTSSVVFRDDWPEWLALFDCTVEDFSDLVRCDTMLAASQAAIDGLGIAMGRTPLVNRDIEEGRLVELCGHRLKSDTGYYLTSSESRAQRRPVQLFTQWLLDRFHR